MRSPSLTVVSRLRFVPAVLMLNSLTDASVAVLAYFIDVTPFESNHVLDNLMAYLPAIQEPQTSVVVPVVDFAPFQAEVEHFDYLCVSCVTFSNDSSLISPTDLSRGLNSLNSTYSGSLTTPPCSEGVFWHIATTPLKLRAETYLNLKHVTKVRRRHYSPPSSSKEVQI